MGSRAVKPEVCQAILRFIKLRGRSLVRDVAKYFRVTVSTLEMLLGRQVVREERFQAGNRHCVFRAKMDSAAPKREFRFEPGMLPAA